MVVLSYFRRVFARYAILAALGSRYPDLLPAIRRNATVMVRPK